MLMTRREKGKTFYHIQQKEYIVKLKNNINRAIFLLGPFHLILNE